MQNQILNYPMNPSPFLAFGPAYPNFKNSEATLYVGNLNPMVTDEMFYQIASRYGQVTSSHVMKDIYSRESREYGFITYPDINTATKAQKDLNCKEEYMRELRVYFKKNTKIFNKDANYIVKNIEKSITSKQFLQECEQYGEVCSCFVRKDVKDNKLVSCGFGYVQFEKVENGENFFQNFNGKSLNGQKLIVEKHISSTDRKKIPPKNLYIKNLPEEMNEAQVNDFLLNEFKQFGTIQSKFVSYHERNKSYFSFVAFDEAEAAKKAQEGMNDKIVNGKALFVAFAESKVCRKKKIEQDMKTSTNQTNLYIKSIKADVTEDKLREAFSAYGKVTSVCLREFVKRQNNAFPAKEVSNVPAQFGFVNFEKSEEAQNAILNGKKDKNVRELILPEIENFIFFFQTKTVRKNFLAMQKRLKDSMNKNLGPRPMQGHPQKGFYQKGKGKNPMMPQVAPFGMVFQPGFDPQQMGYPPGINMPMTPQMTPNSNQKTSDVPEQLDYIKIASNLRAKKDEFLKQSVEEQKNTLGNIMYQRVKSVQKDEELIPKITGMLIDTEVLEFDEIMEIIEDEKALKERIEEAIEVIKENKEGEDHKN